MTKLVELNNDQIITTSVNIAETFEKRHDHLMRDIDKLEKDVPNFGEMFQAYNGRDSYGRFRKEYLINRDGFTLLAMGFTGKKALEFKLKYIEAFNEMENQLKEQPRILTEKEQLVASMKLSIETSEEVSEIKEDVAMLKDSMRISSSQQLEIQNRAKQKVVKALGGKLSLAYKTYNRKAFSSFWREFKNFFHVARYSDITKVKFDDAINWISEWQPDTTTKIIIREINKGGK